MLRNPHMVLLNDVEIGTGSWSTIHRAFSLLHGGVVRESFDRPEQSPTVLFFFQEGSFLLFLKV
jgi:hypothetical protein